MKSLSSLTLIASLIGILTLHFSFTSTTTTDKEALLQEAVSLEKSASGQAGVSAVIKAYEKVLRLDSMNYQALCKIGNYKSLLGAAYTKKKKEKKKLYLASRASLEKAMETNPDYVQKLSEGKHVSEAIEALSIKEIDAMGYWFTVNFYYYKECLGIIGKMKNVQLIEDCNTMIDRVEQLDSTWSGGGVYFSRAIYYIAMPEKFGGSKAKARELFEKAYEIAPNMICNRWGRAKYLYALTGEKDKYKADLNWVIERTKTRGGDNYLPPAWNIHFQEEAEQMLKELD